MQWKTIRLTACQKETLKLNRLQTCTAGAKKRTCVEAAEYRCTGAEIGIVIHEQHYCEIHKDEHERTLGPHDLLAN